jgi:stage II sporulation protein D
MNITNRTLLRRSLSLALASVLSGCVEFIVRVDAASLVPISREAHHIQDRRTQQRTDSPSYVSPDGPMIRVALFTDVGSVSVSASSGLLVSRSIEEFADGEKISNGPLRIELRRTDESNPLVSNSGAYSVFVGSSVEAANARKIEDRLKLEFFEPTAITFEDSKNQYVVTIGRFTTRSEAEKMVERLREAAYKAPRVVASPISETFDSQTPEFATDTNARVAKHKAETRVPTAVKSDRRGTQIVAIAADRILASSADELTISAGEAIAHPAKTSKYEPLSTLGVVRVGNKDYRGEIHFVLNPRGRINVVNALPLEVYLRGVVPMEISASAYAELEAIKAQAVASRSFALASLGHRGAEGYDLVADSRAQVYGGVAAEREVTTRAIEETRGVAAVFPNEDGRLTPIQALYTANCGGRTENNEEVFGGKALPYLRSVACVNERQSLAGRDIVTTRPIEKLTAIEGHSIAREVALLSVLGLTLPHRVTSHYLHGTPDQDEVRGWAEQVARLTRKENAVSAKGDTTRLAEFIRLVAACVYGEGRESALLSSNEVDYLLSGIRIEQLLREARADVAILLRDGVLRLNGENSFDGRATITRGQAIEMMARALLLKSPTEVKSSTANWKTLIPELRFDIAAPAENGKLIVALSDSPTDEALLSRPSSLTEAKISSQAKTSKVAAKQIAKSALVPQAGFKRKIQHSGIDIAEAAGLFRRVGGESYAVDRLTLIGGERVIYHLNSAGQADFLEATVSERGASSDSSSAVAPWLERVAIEELQRRLTRARLKVGRPAQIEPVSFSASRRIIEVEVRGNEGHARLGRSQIRTALGLKEHLFKIDRETDGRGNLTAFVFSGKGLGHGVGMCQTGAYRMAKEGSSFTAILQKYYTGIKVQEMYRQ